MTSPHSTRQGQTSPTEAGTGPGQPAAYPGRDEPPGRTAAGPPGFWLGSDVAAAAWPAFMAAGIGSLILGVILLAWPKETLTIVAVLIGAALIVAGLLRLVDGFTAHDPAAAGGWPAS